MADLHSVLVDEAALSNLQKGPRERSFSFAETRALTRALRAGDEAAFRFLHTQWNHRLFGYCFVLAHGDGVLAGEITQATYLRALRHLRQLPHEEALWQWLTRAARCAAADLRRTGGRYRRALGRFADWLRHASHNRAGADDEMSLLMAALDQAMAELNEDQRRLLEARYADQCPLETIARAHGTTPRAIEGRLARLRHRLRRAIKHHLQNLSRA